MKVVIDQNIPFIKGALEKYLDVFYLPAEKISSQCILDADILIIRTRTKCNEKLLKNSKVKLIISATIGYDHLDIDYLKKNNINWKNCPGCNSSSVQQYIASTLITLANRYSLSLKNLTLGIIGCGNVGKKVEQISDVLGIKVLKNDPPRERQEGKKGFSSLELIQKEADFITIHTPLIKSGRDKTHHLVDMSFLKKMKENSFLINTSRGETVNNQHLKTVLSKSLIQGAVLDVWENEPFIDTDLLDLLDIATGHIAGYSVDGKARGTKMAVQALGDYLKIDNLKKWEPQNLPKITIDFSKMTLEEKILSTYKIITDDSLLRGNTKNFEKLRSNYNYRRDFSYFMHILKA